MVTPVVRFWRDGLISPELLKVRIVVALQPWGKKLRDTRMVAFVADENSLILPGAVDFIKP
jgi:hypothetical protein